MKKLGVIGGMGPEASAYFHCLFVRQCAAATDQDHPDAFFLDLPSIPDRSAYILGRSERSPAGALIAAAKTLEGLGADIIAIPCVTSHHFYAETAGAVNIQILHILRIAAERMRELGVSRVGLLATEGTIKSGFAADVMGEYGIDTLVPGEGGQDLLMRLIYDVIKAGKPCDMALFGEILKDVGLCGAERFVLGCTELSLINRDFDLGDSFIDPLELLAERAALICKEP